MRLLGDEAPTDEPDALSPATAEEKLRVAAEAEDAESAAMRRNEEVAAVAERQRRAASLVAWRPMELMIVYHIPEPSNDRRAIMGF